MKKYLSIAAFLLFGNEILSWAVLMVLAVMALVDFVKEVDRETGR